VIGKLERHVRKASHCDSKQQQISFDEITLLLVRATYIWVLFFAHIPFVVNRTFNATPTERLQNVAISCLLLPIPQTVQQKDLVLPTMLAIHGLKTRN